ncbi:MAG: PAS domain S-box protein [Desulfobacteraceae bacterium]|nr:PAS domain S-box protein [Desulfobacteraceae bacterium]
MNHKSQEPYQSLDVLQEKQRRLQIAEAQLRAIFNNAPSGIIFVDEQGTITFANQRMAEMLGFDLAGLVGSAYLDYIYEPELQEAEQKMFQLIRGEIDHVTTERQYRRKNGTVFWGKLVGTQMNSPEGSSLGILGIISDVTAQKEAEQNLKAAYSKLDKLVELNLDGIMVIDLEGTILFINPAAAQMLGRTETELVGEQFGYPLTPDENTEIDLLSGNGRVKVVELRTSKTEWDGKTAILASFRDITDRKQAEQDLRENEEELTAIYENAPLIMMLVDKERKIRKANSFTSRFAGLSVEEIKDKRGGEALYCLHHLEDSRGCGFGTQCEHCVVRNTVLDTFETGQSHSHLEASLPLMRQDEEKEYTFLVSTTLLRHNEDPLVLLAIMNITERKEAEENLRHMGFRDSLTSLYNRNFLEEEMNRLQDGRHSPIGIIICDVDGLKFINDTLGHQY